ncbi:AraC family transcriptional regulator [Bosea sp. BK604]|uniref:AraC family transcriptional regulator n=1 Tax=Bosea sp. BK604 TaxID=2512180 RepID=UPI00104F26A8|nr:AraC family transcriptional regulator [Bosea sp. BK604]TCR66435.1 AraC-like DNA-binding protein [Bosea sp. BK604]
MARVDLRNSSRYWRDPRVPGLSCLVADFTSHDYAPHSHEAFVVAVTEAGGAEFKSRGRTDEARTSTLLVFNPDEPHSGWMGWSSRWLYRGLYLTSPAIETLKTALGLDTTAYFTRNIFNDPDLIHAFLSLHRILDDGNDPLEERELLLRSFGALIRRHAAGEPRLAQPARDQAKATRIREIMRERHAEELTLEQLGAEVGLTPFQLIALFKRSTGLTPHAYLTQLRLKAAIAALGRGAPIAAAALDAGFYDQSALTRHFKRAYGITPLQWVHAAAD